MRNFIRLIVAALAYAVLGISALALAIPPGYASPVFPAAGLAAALTLHFGNRILFGIWFGSMTINLAVAWQNGKLDAIGIATAAVLASGAVLQAWGGRWLVLRWVGESWRRLESEKDIALFLVTAAPLACLTSATVGVFTLSIVSIIRWQEFLYSWWNWWVGDSLGVLVFAPLTLMFIYRNEPSWRERRLKVAAPILATFCLVVVAFLGVSRQQQNQQVEEIGGHGSILAKALDQRFIAHQEAFSALKRLIEVMPDMTFRQFEYFTRISLQDNKDIFALSYNHYVLHSSRRAFEQSMKKVAGSSYSIMERDNLKQLVPAADNPCYVPVGFIAPLEGNRPAIGFNIYSEPIRRDAIQRAIKSGRIAVTAPIQLVQEKQKRVGVLVLTPAYRDGGMPAGRGIENLIGFAVGVVKVDEMVQIATRNLLPEGMVFRLSDRLATAERRTLYQSDGGSNKPLEPYIFRTQLTMADRQWSLEVFPTAGYLHKKRSWFAWGIGIAGLLFTALLQVMMLAMTGRTSVIEQTVHEQTELLELEMAERQVAQEALAVKQLQLEEINCSLQERVDGAIAELRQKDQMLISQSRQAAMGEMIGNIAHQWRQPINALAILLANIQQAHQYNELTAEYLGKSVRDGNRLIQKMSTTINDFRNFFSPDKEAVAFSACDQITSAIALVETAYKNQNIVILFEASNDLILTGLPNEYSQVLLNLLSNARDAINDHEISEGKITICLYKHDGQGCVSVSDNGGGISTGVLDKIFEPYFSTKNMGTGIGLYMSKMIVERSMNGTIEAHNIEGGAEFIIMTPLLGRLA